MNIVSIEDFRARLDEYLAAAADRDLILTHEGKPWLLLRAIRAEEDEEAAALGRSAEFWEMIHKRRQEQGIPWEQARQELGLEQEEPAD